MAGPGNAPSYEDDFVAWLEDQAQRARRGETESRDLQNIAEELEGMARNPQPSHRSADASAELLGTTREALVKLTWDGRRQSRWRDTDRAAAACGSSARFGCAPAFWNASGTFRPVGIPRSRISRPQHWARCAAASPSPSSGVARSISRVEWPGRGAFCTPRGGAPH